ncbi:hypothetical protein CAPTEDRAFT_221898 [Capitella teleta]|uniref:28S ribosomal protein S36, mitochondrial n=1 Tax=Capitella teleta TaxID=283909 RepID=R7T8B3_CAPTE|nr:hypothetical protein CAPTEDRAFT_221898 [Capitella teleta]|eukprot:ELT87219.1 hypothetical protein CAPTEDRAFT_221898 [Capitella teleta]
MCQIVINWERYHKATEAVHRRSEAVRAHVPLIKFPSRLTAEVPNATTAAPSPLIQTIPTTANELFQPQTSTQKSGIPKWKADEQPVGKTPRGSGIDFKDMPAKYKRRPIDEEEIAYILRGGPE